MSDGAGYASPVAEGPWAGWLSWKEPFPGTFLDSLGTSYSRSDARGRATVMLETKAAHASRLGPLHGGMLAGFADHAYFAAVTAMGLPEQADGVTIDLSLQYCGAGRVGPHLRAEVELLRETGRLIFMRMSILQGDELVAASTATIRKASTRK